MYSKRFKSLVSIIVITIMLLDMNFNTNSYWLSVGNEGSIIVEAKETKEEIEPIVVKELKDFRTENSSTYLLSDGSRRLEISDSKLHFEEDGKFKVYDATLKETSKSDKNELKNITKDKNIINKNNTNKYAYVNTAGDSKQYFPATLNSDTGVILEKEDYVIEFHPVFDDKARLQNTLSNEVSTLMIQNDVNSDVDITYTQHNLDIDIKYTSYTSGIKEEIILYRKPDTNIFEFEFNVPGLILQKHEYSKRILLIDNDTENVIAYIEEPNIKDENSEYSYDEVEYEIVEQEEGYVLKVIVEDSYFDSINRDYPVVIDPTVVWMDSALQSATLSSFEYTTDVNMLNGNYFDVQNRAITSYPHTSTEYMCAIKVSTIPASGSLSQFFGSVVENANLKIVEYSSSAYTPGTIEIRAINSEWNPSTVTWNTKPEIGNTIWSQFTCTGIANRRHDVDLTEWAQAVADGDIDNYGLVLKSKEVGKGSRFYGSSLQNINYMQLSITYWPYIFNVNNYYDRGFSIRYGAMGTPSIKINEALGYVEDIYIIVFGLKFNRNIPTQIISMADNCKLSRGIPVNTNTINDECKETETHNLNCTRPLRFYGDFISRYPGNNTTASIIWTGHQMYNADADGDGEGEDTDRSFRAYDNGIAILKIEPYNTYYNKVLPTLTHELAHSLGVLDHYHDEINDECRNEERCPECNPDTGRDKDCIMYRTDGVDIRQLSPYSVFCDDCINDINEYIETYL